MTLVHLSTCPLVLEAAPPGRARQAVETRQARPAIGETVILLTPSLHAY